MNNMNFRILSGCGFFDTPCIGPDNAQARGTIKNNDRARVLWDLESLTLDRHSLGNSPSVL